MATPTRLRIRTPLRQRRTPRLAPALQRELAAEPRWMYPWDLGRGTTVPLAHPSLPLIHRTRAEMMEGPVRTVLAQAGPGATALDLACNEGWFAHKLLEWGAARVVGLDIREVNVRRAQLLRDHYGIDPARLHFEQADVFDLDPERLGKFDVVLVLGLVYHVENPVGALRIARACTRTLCVVESQLTRQVAPVTFGAGPGEPTAILPGSFGAYIEPDSEANPLASAAGVLSLVPNRAALELMLTAAGFAQIDIPTAQAHHAQHYINGDRAVALAR
jgi:hypothetical protein